MTTLQSVGLTDPAVIGEESRVTSRGGQGKSTHNPGPFKEKRARSIQKPGISICNHNMKPTMRRDASSRFPRTHPHHTHYHRVFGQFCLFWPSLTSLAQQNEAAEEQNSLHHPPAQESVLSLPALINQPARRLLR